MYDVNLTQSHFPPQADVEIRDVTIGESLRVMAADRGDAEALVEVTQDGQIDRRWSYSDLLADSEKLADALATRFEPGEKIAVWAPNCPEWVLLEFASALAGLVLVTANPAFQVKELRYVLEQSQASGLFMVSEFRGNPMASIAAEAAKGPQGLRETVDTTNSSQLFAAAQRTHGLPAVSFGDAA
ncbi:MAG: AMP-binding protein, partial [Rhodobacteraceae bacterium]|nr:AMP-binding protein [Paracoccaceae bacterium]